MAYGWVNNCTEPTTNNYFFFTTINYFQGIPAGLGLFWSLPSNHESNFFPHLLQVHSQVINNPAYLGTFTHSSSCFLPGLPLHHFFVFLLERCLVSSGRGNASIWICLGVDHSIIFINVSYNFKRMESFVMGAAFFIYGINNPKSSFLWDPTHKAVSLKTTTTMF